MTKGLLTTTGQYQSYHLYKKILERMMYNCLPNFLNKSNILKQNQYGCRESQSTFIVLLNLVNDISEELNDKNHSICIL